MIKYYWTVVLFLLGSTLSHGQSYTLKTAEGKPVTVQLNDELTNNELKVSSGNHCISIKGVTGLQDKPEIINDQFLKVNYSLSNGSETKTRYTVLYGVKQKELYEALHILSEYGWEGTTGNTKADGPDGEGYYKVLLQFENKTIITADIFLEHTSKENLLDNYMRNTKATLTPDKRSNIFITEHKQMKGSYTFKARTNANTSVSALDGTYPAIILENREYYYINNTWYEKEKPNELTACSQQECN